MTGPLLLALLLLLVAVGPGLPRAVAADRSHRRYLQVRQRYQRVLARQSTAMLNLTLRSEAEGTSRP